MKRLYLDSNVFISLVNRELDSNLRPLFIEAEQFIEKAKELNCTIVLSDHTLEEIQKISFNSKNDVIELFEKKQIKIEFINKEKQDIEKVKFFCRRGVHRSDAWHIALAIKAKCDCIVTFNKKDFEITQDLILAEEPLLLFLK